MFSQIHQDKKGPKLNEMEITTNTTEIQRIIRDYYEQLYTNEMDNLEGRDKFLEIHNLLRLNQEKTKYEQINYQLKKS